MRLSKTAACDFLIIRSGHRSVYGDLIRCCSKDRNYLILLDDANDISDLSSIREFVSMNDNVQVMATLRNYVKENAVKELRHIKGFCEFVLPPMGEEAIKNILEKQFAIANQEHLQQIIRVSRGNLRLAILAAETLRQSGAQGIINIKELLSMCYESKLSLFSNNEKTAISIASILGAHETENNAGLAHLEEICKIDHCAYIAACRTLHEKELLDAIHDFEAINFEEQNLRDYFIYQSVVKDHIFTLRDLWGLPNGARRVSSIANILLNVFYCQEVRGLLATQLKDIWENSGSEERKQLIRMAGSLIPLESLAFLDVEIQNFETKDERANYLNVGLRRTDHFGFESEILELSSIFFDDIDNWMHAFLIALTLLQKDNTYVDDYCHIFDSLLKPNKYSFYQGFTREHFVFQKLHELYESTQDATYAILLIRFARVILSDEVEGTEMGEENQLHLYRGVLPYSEELVKFRRECITYLKNLRKDSRFRDMADSIVFDYVGQSANGEPSLAKSTVGEIIAVYEIDKASLSYSLLDNIWVFRYRNASFLGEDSWIDALFRSQRALQLVELCVIPLWRRCKKAEEFEKEIHAVSVRMTEEDWTLFINLIRRDFANRKRRDLSTAAEAISWMIGQNAHKRSPMIDMLIDAVFEFGLRPDICCRNIFRYLMEIYPDQSLRSVVMSRSSDELKAAWASCCDSYILEQDGDYEVFCLNVLNGLASYGETVSPETVLDAETAKPGFLGRYCEAMTASSIVGADYKRFFILNLASCDEEKFEAAIDNPSNLSRVEDLICGVLRECEDFWYGKDICKRVIRINLGFIFKLLSAWIDENSESHHSFDESISDLYWEIEEPIENLPKLTTIANVATLGFFGIHALEECVSSIVKTGVEKGKGDEVLRWLSNEAVRDTPFSRIANEVATSLNTDSRLTFCILSCENDIPVETFSRAAFSLPFDGAAWSGSAIPLIDRKINYVKDLQNALIESGYLKYFPATEEYLQYLLKRKHHEEISEFVDPFYG